MVGYTLILLITYAMFFMKYKYGGAKLYKVNFIFLILYILFPIISLIQMPLNDYITAMIRYCALLPIAIFGLIYPNYIQKNMYSILKIFCTIVFISSLLMIYQTFFGTIEIFGEVTERLGRSRYTSLLGSTTAYGTIAPVALLIINLFKDMYSKKEKSILQIFIIIGGIICLSKSFYVNILIIYGLLFLDIKFERRINIKKLITIIVSVCIGIITLVLLIKYTPIGNYFNDMINYTFNSKYNGVDEDLIDRLTVLPKHAFDFHKINLFNLLFGVGFKGYSGVLGLPNYPMCHNNYSDLILSQGIFFFCLIIFIYFKGIIINIRTKDSKGKFIFKLIAYILFNMLAGQWNYLTPIPMIFTLVIVSFINLKKRDISISYIK